MNRLSFDDGIISVSGKQVPGILISLKVDGKIRYDEQKIDSGSGHKRTPQGWEDSIISAQVALLTDDAGTCYDKLTELNAIFLDHDGSINPKIFTVANKHLAARGVGQVVFAKLSSSETEQNDEIIATLGFDEYEPAIRRLEKAAAKASTPGSMAKQALAGGPGGGGIKPPGIDSNGLLDDLIDQVEDELEVNLR